MAMITGVSWPKIVLIKQRAPMPGMGRSARSWRRAVRYRGICSADQRSPQGWERVRAQITCLTDRGRPLVSQTLGARGVE